MRLFQAFSFEKVPEHRFRREEIPSRYVDALRWLWARLLPLIPEAVTPNAMTLAGQFAFIGSSLLVLALWIRSGATTLPTWSAALLFVTAVFCWFMDGMDGMQARRTGRTSTLGELYDHGLDTLTYMLSMVLSVVVLGGGFTPQTVAYVVFAEMLATALPVMQRLTGTILFTASTDVSRTAFVGVLLVRAIFGPDVWVQPRFWGTSAGALVLLAVAAGIAFETVRQWGRIARDPRGRVAMLAVAVCGACALAPIAWLGPDAWRSDVLVAQLAIGCLFSALQVRVQVGTMTGGGAFFEELSVLAMPVLLVASYLLPVPTLVASLVLFGVQFVYFATNIARYEQRSGTVGYAAGVFDYCHPGHVSFLRRAAARCDRLVVAVCTDRYARSYKERPTYSEAERVEAVRALGVARAIVLVDGDHKVQYERFSVTHVFHGDDWPLEPYVDHMNRRAITERAIEVVLLPHTPGISSTALRREASERRCAE